MRFKLSKGFSFFSPDFHLLTPFCYAAFVAALATSVLGSSSCALLDYEYLLPTATVTIQLCSTNEFDLSEAFPPCPVGSSEKTAFAVASIVACSDSVAAAQATPDIACSVLSCPCTDEDDDECADCTASRARNFPCFSSSLQVANRSSCLRLWSRIPVSSISRKMSAVGQFSLAHDRLIFKMSSFLSQNLSTPSLGPWSLSRLHRWHLAHANEDDYHSALDLKYRLIRLGDEWPDALCLDGSKGAYYM